MGFKIKKTVNDETVWESIKAKKYTAPKITEYTGALPITINADGNSLLDYRIYGNTEQADTPTPENPIMPIGYGERVDITGLSEPLCGIKTYTDSLDLSTGILTRRIKKLVLTGDDGGDWKRNTAISSGNSYTNQLIFTDYKTQSGIGYCTHYPLAVTSNAAIGMYFGIAINFITDFSEGIDTVEKWKSYLAAQYAAGTPVTVWYVLAEPEISTISVPSGLTGTIEGYLIQDGTPTPETPIYPTANGVKQADDTYSIPYGYKLPILSNSAVTNIYLGEVQTTRRIKKLVLTGTEDWTTITRPTYTYATSITPCVNNSSAISSHFIQKDFIILANKTFSIFNKNKIYIKYNDTTSVDDFKQFLAAQYAAGTPVTVWYVLAEPETGIVNEPLMKIGDYADTVDITQTSVQIPTYKGTTVINNDGTTKPSQLYIKYNSWSGWEDIDNYKMANENWTQEVTE